MLDDTTDSYARRFAQVFEYIEQNLGSPLTLEQLSEAAHFSRYHFHRQFTAWCGMPVGRYILLMRLKFASFRLAFNPSEKIIDIALDAGFQSPEAFSRAFRQVFGVSPSQFRKQPAWESWHRNMPELKRKRTPVMNVTIMDFPETRVAMLTHRGPVELIKQTAARFIEWRKTTGLSPVTSSFTYGIAPDDPATTPVDVFRYDICGSVNTLIDENNAFGVVNSTIPAGRCAVLRHHGSHDALTELAWYLYRTWLPQSGEELRDFPLYFHYHNFVHQVPEHELVTDIYLPIK